MNERIKELILEAGFPKFDEMYVVSDGKELERFSELIVKECVDICIEVNYKYENDDTIAYQCAREIEKHFGVEE